MPDTPIDTPAERLKLSRTRAGFARAIQAADRLGMPHPTYTAHENGGRDFGRDQCLQYADLFSVDPAWLMFGSGYGRPPGGAPPSPEKRRLPNREEADEVELLNVTISGEGTIRIVHSPDMTSEKAKALLRGFVPTILPPG